MTLDIIPRPVTVSEEVLNGAKEHCMHHESFKRKTTKNFNPINPHQLEVQLVD